MIFDLPVSAEVRTQEEIDLVLRHAVLFHVVRHDCVVDEPGVATVTGGYDIGKSERVVQLTQHTDLIHYLLDFINKLFETIIAYFSCVRVRRFDRDSHIYQHLPSLPQVQEPLRT